MAIKAIFCLDITAPPEGYKKVIHYYLIPFREKRNPLCWRYNSKETADPPYGEFRENAPAIDSCSVLSARTAQYKICTRHTTRGMTGGTSLHFAWRSRSNGVCKGVFEAEAMRSTLLQLFNQLQQMWSHWRLRQQWLCPSSAPTGQLKCAPFTSCAASCSASRRAPPHLREIPGSHAAFRHAWAAAALLAQRRLPCGHGRAFPFPARVRKNANSGIQVITQRGTPLHHLINTKTKPDETAPKVKTQPALR